MADTSKRRRTRADLVREARRLGLSVRANATAATIEKQIADARRRATRANARRPASRRKASEKKPAANPKQHRTSRGRRETDDSPPPLPIVKPAIEVPAPTTQAPSSRSFTAPTAGRNSRATRPSHPSVTIVPRSPDWLFAYFRNANGGPTVLRVHDATVHDVDVPDGAIHAFVPVTPDTSGVRVEMGVRERSGEFTAIARSNPVDTPPTRATTTVDPQWPIDPRAEEVHARALRALGGASSRMESEVSLPTSPAPPFPGASKRLNVGAGSPTESGRAVPSTEGGAGQRARDFFLEVGTDLIVHGATVPGSTVTIRGERVMLRTDGTFSIRMALPDGVHDFEVRATSPDGIETRVVDLRVTRELRARKGR